MVFDPKQFLQAYTQNSLAVIIIDLQHRFQYFNKDVYKKYNKDCTDAIEFYRKAGISIIHVAGTMIENHTLYEIKNSHLYEDNKNDICLDISKEKSIRQDMLNEMKDGEILVLKNCNSVFHDRNELLHNHLQSKGIKDLLFIGMYGPDCVYDSMRSAHAYKDYNIFVATDLVEDIKVEKTRNARIERNTRLFTYNNFNYGVTDQKQIQKIITPSIITNKQNGLIIQS